MGSTTSLAYQADMGFSKGKFIVYFCYGHAPAITARISPQPVHGIPRLIAFVLLCIGVQITSNGIEAIVKTMSFRM